MRVAAPKLRRSLPILAGIIRNGCPWCFFSIFIGIVCSGCSCVCGCNLLSVIIALLVVREAVVVEGGHASARGVKIFAVVHFVELVGYLWIERCVNAGEQVGVPLQTFRVIVKVVKVLKILRFSLDLILEFMFFREFWQGYAHTRGITGVTDIETWIWLLERVQNQPGTLFFNMISPWSIAIVMSAIPNLDTL